LALGLGLGLGGALTTLVPHSKQNFALRGTGTLHFTQGPCDEAAVDTGVGAGAAGADFAKRAGILGVAGLGLTEGESDELEGEEEEGEEVT